MKNKDFNKLIDFLRLIISIFLLLIAIFNSPLTILLIVLVFFLLGIDVKIDKGIKIKLGTMFETTKNK